MKYNINIKSIQLFFIISLFIFIVSCEPGSDPVQYCPEPNSIDNYFVYNSYQKYSDVLITCTIRAMGTCSLNTLPLIGLDNEDPSINNIMNRLIVSHSWIGKRFKEFLEHYPKEALTLFRSITAIVITGNTRPSRYHKEASVIFIDPKDLWLTKAEYCSISKKKDYRTHFGDTLSFQFLRRPFKDNIPVYKNSPLSYHEDKSIQDVAPALSVVVFHELAHANDYFHPTDFKNYKRDMPISSFIPKTSQSEKLNKIYPNFGLSSKKLKILAMKKYLYGVIPRGFKQLLQLSATEVANEFFRDNSNDFYNYATVQEDFAMLFETVMSKKFFNVEYEIAFTNNPKNTSDCKNFIIAQGRRNRIASPSVKPRALRVANKILPSIDWDTFFKTEILEETSLSQGKNWCF